MNIKNLRYDIKSSIVVFLVAIPLCLGISLASNAPLSSGIIAGIIGGLVAGFISGSEVSVSGPAAGLTVLVAMGIEQLGSFHSFAQAVIIAGIIQILMGLLRGGAIADYVPVAVIKGMLAAIGLILILKQSKYALGLPSTSWDLRQIHGGIACISLLSMSIIFFWEKYSFKLSKGFQLVPAALIAVLVSVVLNLFFKIIPSEQLVQLPLQLFSEVQFHPLNFSWDIFTTGITIALVASLETLLCLDASEKIDSLKRKPSKNRELIAQGVSNSLSGFLGGLPLTAVIVRTSANISAGAKSKFSAIYHGLWLLLSVLFIPHLINLIPLATLSGVLILVGYKLTKPNFFFEMRKRGNEQLFIFVATIVAILLTDLLKGIAIGMVISLILEAKHFSFKGFTVHESDSEVHLKFRKNH
jgi:MFS superfamily sulfate permease-like transporter